jgi:anthranilate phosphoribosyltransferase
MASILAGDATPSQLTAFVVALRSKGEAADELAGMLAAVREAAVPVELSEPVASGALDIVGTGGDGSHSVNISTMAALVLAGGGVPVCKHGNRAASSKCGAADVLEALGVAIELGPAGVARCVEEAGMGFCFAPRFHPAFRHAGPSRREIGVPTSFNLLGPLANPARVPFMVVGVGDQSYAQRMAEALASSGVTRAWVVHGAGGLDELATSGPNDVLAVEGGSVMATVVDPAPLGLLPAGAADVRGGDAAANADVVHRVLGGEPGPIRDVVVMNAAAGFVVAGRAASMEEGVALARQAIDEGAAQRALDLLVAVSTAARAAEADA